MNPVLNYAICIISQVAPFFSQQYICKIHSFSWTSVIYFHNCIEFSFMNILQLIHSPVDGLSLLFSSSGHCEQGWCTRAHFLVYLSQFAKPPMVTKSNFWLISWITFSILKLFYFCLPFCCSGIVKFFFSEYWYHRGFFLFFFFLMFSDHLHFLLIEGNHNSSLLLNMLLSFLSYCFYRYFKVLSDKPFARYIYCTYLLSHFTYDDSLSSYCFFPFLFHLSKFSIILGGDIFSCNLLKAL